MNEQPTKQSKTRSIYFSELSDLRESQLDAAAFVAKGVTLIKSGFSTNTDRAGRPRYYSKETLAAAIPVFEGTRAYANHPRMSDEKELPERDVRDIIGYYENIRASDNKLVGDLHIIGKAREWAWGLIEETKNKSDLVELSINALGKTRIGEAEGKKAIIVESIDKSNSVDMVTTGAAGGSFAGALLMSDGDQWTRDLLESMSFEEWREARADYVEKLKAEWKTVRETEAVKESKNELEKLTTQITALTEASRANDVELSQLRKSALADRLLAESALPYKLREAIRDELIELKDEAAMKAEIGRVKEAFDRLPRSPVSVSGAGQLLSIPVTQTLSVPTKAAVLFRLEESKLPKKDESAEDYKVRITKFNQEK